MSYRTLLKSVSAGALLALVTGLPAQAVVFHTGSGTIDGSLCVGLDCPTSPAFGFDTIRMQENNLRMHFDDTSTAASFPPNDWRLYANDLTNGGSSYFGIEDATAGRFVFRVFAGARSNALTVDSQGDVGLGTTTPALDIDIKTGDTPSIRLQQDGTSGFTPQSWDMAGNETNWFVRDATSGSTLPLRVRVGAPTDSLEVEGDGRVSLGVGIKDDLTILGNEAFFTLDDANDNDKWFVTHQAGNAGNLEFTNELDASGSFTVALTIEPGGDATLAGTLTENSDKNNKMAIEPIDTGEVLEKVAALPVSSWTYKHDAEDGIRHIGPMAQDFYAAFGLGATDKGISTLDTSGVALAAIQALAAENAKLAARVQQLEARIAD